MRHEKPRSPSREDELQREATLAAADGIVEQLKRMVGKDKKRPIATLKKIEIEHLAAGAISAYALKRAEQEATERKNRRNSNLFA